MDVIVSSRLSLRRFDPEDGPRVELLAGESDVASMSGNIPYPYPKGGAVQWIESTRPAILRGLLAQFAVIESRSGELIGCVSLKRTESQLTEAELAYWIGKPFWGQGYGTEAATAAVEYVRSSWGILSLWAGLLPHNQRSARVLAKLGMAADGEYEASRLGSEAPVHLLRFRRRL
jgi:[ribosomal protein S5]-alanine N-acetyltransferase